MTDATHNDVPNRASDCRRPEPRWMTLADLGVMVAAVAVALMIPSRTSGLPAPLSPQATLVFFVLIGGLRLSIRLGLVLALVVIFRRGRYGGPVRPAECLALALASVALVDAVPNLDEAVNGYYAATGSTALDFGVARWLMSAPAAVGVVVVVAALVFLGRRERAGSRFASALMTVGMIAGLFLWFWGPCEVARLQLPWLLVPSPNGEASSWGWRGPVVFALRELVANGLHGLIWGLIAAATIRAWRNNCCSGRARGWVWTERAAIADAIIAALLAAAGVGVLRPIGIARWTPFWIVTIALLSWWLTGRIGPWRGQAASGASNAAGSNR